MTKHIHCDLIKAWADGAEIQFQKDDGSWSSTCNSPSWSDNVEYRIKPEPLKYRVALLISSSGKYYTTTKDSIAPDDGVECRSSFVRWLTDWVEVVR